MEQIIQQIVSDLVEKVLNRIERGEIQDLDALSDGCLEDCRKAAAGIITAAISLINDNVRKDKRLRKELGLRMQQHDRDRSVLTSLGEIKYKRDYYMEEASGQYCFPIDKLLKVSSYERVSKGICAELVNLAADVSYQKSADIVSGGSVSRQTVKNKIKETGILEKGISDRKKDVEELHIHADEDHAHIQKYRKRGKESKIVPYIVLTEGIESVYRSRNRTVSPVHFADKDLDGKALWAKTSAYIYGTYEHAEDVPIYIHSDGGSWIKGWKEELPNAVPIMDMFHFRKELKQANRRVPEAMLSSIIFNNIALEDEKKARERCISAVNEAVRLAKEEKTKKKLKEFRTYLRNNWEGIRNSFRLETSGSCTEGQISHGLSERISRNPMGWSREGVGLMAMLRAYRKNGCRVKAADFRRNDKEKESSKLIEYGQKICQEALAGRRNWSLFTGEGYVFDTSSGTQQLLKIIGKAGQVM